MWRVLYVFRGNLSWKGIRNPLKQIEQPFDILSFSEKRLQSNRQTNRHRRHIIHSFSFILYQRQRLCRPRGACNMFSLIQLQFRDDTFFQIGAFYLMTSKKGILNLPLFFTTIKLTHFLQLHFFIANGKFGNKLDNFLVI